VAEITPHQASQGLAEVGNNTKEEKEK